MRAPVRDVRLPAGPQAAGLRTTSRREAAPHPEAPDLPETAATRRRGRRPVHYVSASADRNGIHPLPAVSRRIARNAWVGKTARTILCDFRFRCEHDDAPETCRPAVDAFRRGCARTRTIYAHGSGCRGRSGPRQRPPLGTHGSGAGMSRSGSSGFRCRACSQGTSRTPAVIGGLVVRCAAWLTAKDRAGGSGERASSLECLLGSS